MSDSPPDPWFDDWGVDMLQYAYMFTCVALRFTNATAVSSTKERMDKLLFVSPVMVNVPISYYSEHKPSLNVQVSVCDVTLSIHFSYTGIPLTIWDLRSVDDLKECQLPSDTCYASVLCGSTFQ